MFNTLLKPPCCNTAAEAKQVVVSNNTISQQSTATETAKKKVLNKKPSDISFKTVVNRELPAGSKLKTKIYSGYIYDENGIKCNITGKSEYKENFGWDYENNPYINTLSLNISDYEIYISIDRTEYIADMLENGYTLEQLLTLIKDGRNVHIHSNTEKGQAFIQRINAQGVEDVTSYKVKKEQAEKEQYENRERNNCTKKTDSSITDSNIVNEVIKLESKKQTLQGYDVHSILNHPLFDDEKRKSGEWAYMINNTVYDANWLFAVVIKNALWNVIDSDSNIEGITRKMAWAVENLGVFNTTYSYNFRGDVLYILPDWSENYRFSISINQTGGAVEADRYSLLYALNEYIERKYKLPNLLSRIAFKPIKKHKTEMELY